MIPNLWYQENLSLQSLASILYTVSFHCSLPLPILRNIISTHNRVVVQALSHMCGWWLFRFSGSVTCTSWSCWRHVFPVVLVAYVTASSVRAHAHISSALAGVHWTQAYTMWLPCTLTLKQNNKNTTPEQTLAHSCPLFLQIGKISWGFTSMYQSLVKPRSVVEVGRTGAIASIWVWDLNLSQKDRSYRIKLINTNKDKRIISHFWKNLRLK